MKRDWPSARAKVMSEGCCRVCRRAFAQIDPAHLIPRSQVRPGIGEQSDNILPLCRAHHRSFDEGKLDVVPYLTRAELGKAFELGGFEYAIRRLTGGAWRLTAVDPA